MKILKMLLVLLTLFGLSGCFSGVQNYYVLSMVSQPSSTYATPHKIIGVDKITVPGYLYKRDITIAQSPSRIALLNHALWGEDLDTGLTNRLIGFLQKKFNLPDVYAYPWDINTQPNIRISVNITRFIAEGNTMYLDATWSVENMKTHKRIAKLFSTRVATSSDVDTIVASMDSAFSKFEETIARGIKSL